MQNHFIVRTVCEAQPVSCPSLPFLENGRITYVGDTARYECFSGFTLVPIHSQIRVCEAGVWDPPEDPTCEGTSVTVDIDTCLYGYM